MPRAKLPKDAIGGGKPGPGRPKGSKSGPCITTRLKNRLLKNPQQANALVSALINGAIEGDAQFMKMVLDRVDGPVKEQIEHGGGMKINVVFGDDPQMPAFDQADGDDDE